MGFWSISGVKSAAWERLKQFGRGPLGEARKNYWQAVVFSLFILLFSTLPGEVLKYWGLDEGLRGWLWSVAFSVLWLNPLMVSNNQYYLWQDQGVCRPREALFSSFRRYRYEGIVKGMFFYTLFISLWTLLLVIPGIVKGYAYRMVPFLLAENPSMSWQWALEVSQRTTYGEKMDMFFLDLSFLGWAFLCIVSFGIGAIFVMPYYCTTWCEVYLCQREKAFHNGWL